MKGWAGMEHTFTKLKDPRFKLKKRWTVRTDEIICPFNGKEYHIAKITGGPSCSGSQIIFSQRFAVADGEDIKDRLEETLLQEYSKLKKMLSELTYVPRKLFDIYDTKIEEVKA